MERMQTGAVHKNTGRHRCLVLMNRGDGEDRRQVKCTTAQVAIVAWGPKAEKPQEATSCHKKSSDEFISQTPGNFGLTETDTANEWALPGGCESAMWKSPSRIRKWAVKNVGIYEMQIPNETSWRRKYRAHVADQAQKATLLRKNQCNLLTWVVHYGDSLNCWSAARHISCDLDFWSAAILVGLNACWTMSLSAISAPWAGPVIVCTAHLLGAISSMPHDHI